SLAYQFYFKISRVNGILLAGRWRRQIGQISAGHEFVQVLRHSHLPLAIVAQCSRERREIYVPIDDEHLRLRWRNKARSSGFVHCADRRGRGGMVAVPWGGGCSRIP